MRKVAMLLAAIFSLALLGCGGSDSTTIIGTAAETSETQATYLPASGIDGKYVEPVEYSFYVDGAVVGRHLTWRGWGSPVATAMGTIDIRDPEGSGAEDRLDYSGSIEAFGLEECRGSSYYTEVIAKLPSSAVYTPEGAIPLLTPCRDGETLPPVPAPPSQTAPVESQAPMPSFFFTPSHNIACSLTPDRVFCDTSERAWTPNLPKPESCDFDWGPRVALDEFGSGEFVCVSDSLHGVPYGVLLYGKLIQRGGISCVSEETGLTCTNASEGGFFLSEQRVGLF